MKKLTIEEFIQKANKVHNNRYDYSECDYVNARSKVKIICGDHGSFYQNTSSHLSGIGCKFCSGRGLTTDLFIKKAKQTHGSKYDYSRTVYSGSHNKVKIICPEHGVFEQHPNSHIDGIGCKTCGYKKLSNNFSSSTEQFIEKANIVHKNKYDYTLVKYVNVKSLILITCPSHGEFKQKANSHLSGTGCPYCNESKGENRLREYLDKNKIKYTTQEWFKYNERPCKNPETNKSLRFDFYLSDYNLCVEYNGMQHYRPIAHFGGEMCLLNTQQRDQIKRQYCLDHDIKLLEIPYTNFKNIETILQSQIVGK